MSVRIQLRRDSAANWTSVNPTLASGEVGVEVDTHRLKVGDGATAWASLPYSDDPGHDAATYQAALAVADKTANYTSVGNEIVRVDATSGAVTITLPTAPSDKTRVTVKKTDTSTNAVTVARGGTTDVFNKPGGSTTLTLSLQFQAVTVQYDHANAIWTVVSDDLPLGQLDTRYTQFSGSTFTNMKIGGAPQSAYTVEAGQDNDNIASDLSFVRIRARGSRGTTSPSSFYGVSTLRVEMEDTANVVGATTAPYLYGVRVRAVPRYGRNQSGVDDLVGVCITNQSYSQLGTSYNGTEAVYIGYGGGSTGGASKDWNAGVGIDTVADKGMYIVRGPYDYGILMTASFTTAAIRIPNNAPIIGRNSTDSASLDLIRADTGNNLRLGSAGVKVVVGTPNQDTDVTQAFEVHNTGNTDGNLGHSHIRVVDNQAFAANIGGTIAFAGYIDSATPRTIRTFGGIAGRKTNSTSGNAAGYLSLFSRNASTGLVEVLRLNETQQIVVTDASNIVLGTTTGTQIGTATTQKLALYGKTPIVQPTTGVAAAAFVANSGTAVNDASTFGGYTIKQVVQALQNLGVLA